MRCGSYVVGFLAGVVVLVGCGSGATTQPAVTVTATATVTATPSPTASPTILPIAGSLTVNARIGQQPLANATVQVYEAQNPAPLTIGVTDLDGVAQMVFEAPPDAGLYVTTRGGQLGEGRGVSAPVELATLIGAERPSAVVVDERTTVAAAYTAAELVATDGRIVASTSELDAAAVAAAGLVDPRTGQLGANGQTQAATINTLASAVIACAVREPTCQALTMTSSGSAPQNAATTFAGLSSTARDPARGAGSIFAVQQGYDDLTPTLQQPPDEFVIDY